MNLKTITSFFSCLTISLSAAPNVIFVMTDDLGFGDLYSFHQHTRDNGAGTGGIAGDGIRNGTEEAFIYTPNLDTMAAEGAMMTRHYTSAPVCAPARASFLQGRDQGHANVRNNDFDDALEDNHTVGTVMQQAGYATACIGKWGLQGGQEKGGSPTISPAFPTKRGFDFFFGYLDHSAGHRHYPKENPVDGNDPDGQNTIWENNTDITQNCDKSYSTDLFTARAKKWIVDHRTSSPSQPFFLYLAYTAPHAALQVGTQAYPSYTGANDSLTGGLQWNGTAGNIINTASGTIDSYIHPDYSTLANSPKRHASMIRRLDNAMGDLSQLLKDLNIDDNTIVVFTSDNGAHHEGSWTGVVQDPRTFDSYGTLDGTKRDQWEGGIRVPTIARWPGNITAGSNSIRPSAFWDWMPTFTDAAGVTAPAWTSGVSLLPHLTNSGTQKDKGYLYFEYYHNSSTPSYADFDTDHHGATRREMQTIFLDDDSDGIRYKGVRYNTTSHTGTDFRIYNVDLDPGERNNVADSHTTLQLQMKDKVLQVRRADKKYPRPYDDEFIPSVSVSKPFKGLTYKTYSGNWPWVPQFSQLKATASGVAKFVGISKSLKGDNFGLEFDGYFKAPKDGNYTFTLSSDGGSMLWLHDIHLIDNDFKNDDSEKSATIKLKAGYHPLRVAYAHKDGKPSLKLNCSTADKAQLKDLAKQFYHSK